MGNAMFTWKCNAHNLVLPQRVSCPECANVARQRLHAQGVAASEYLFSQELKVPTCVSALDPCDKRWALTVNKAQEESTDNQKSNVPYMFAKKFIDLFRPADLSIPSVMNLLRWLDAGHASAHLGEVYSAEREKDVGSGVIAYWCMNRYLKAKEESVPNRAAVRAMFDSFWEQGQAVIPVVPKVQAPTQKMLEEATSKYRDVKKMSSAIDRVVVDDLYQYILHSSHQAYLSHVRFEKRAENLPNPSLPAILDWARVLVTEAVVFFKKDFGASAASYTGEMRTMCALRIVLDYLEGHRRGG